MNKERSQPISKALLHYMNFKKALDQARDSPDRNSGIYRILSAALFQVWAKVLAHEDRNVMSPEEFSLFNFFQELFVGNEKAIAARKRYWDYTVA